MSQNKIGLFELDKINLEQGTKEILQRAIDRIDSREKLADKINSFSEKSQEISYPVDPILGAISGYDMIISITQGQINSHFEQHIRDLQFDFKDNSGCIKAKMKPPSISLSGPESQNYLILKLSLESGEYQYEDKNEIIDNWIIALKIKIGFEAVDKSNQEVYKIFLDFKNSDLPKIYANFESINMDKFIEILRKHLKDQYGVKNPFNIGYFAITKDASQTRDIMPIIRPTYCRYSLYKSRLKEDLNRINILFMMDGHEPPKDFHFGEELDCYQNGVIIISKSIFEHNLLETIILPEFLSSIQEQFSSNHEYPILKMIHEGLDYHSIGCNGWVKSNRIYSYKQDHTRLLLDSHIFYDNDIVFPSENLFLAHDPRISPEQDHRNPL